MDDFEQRLPTARARGFVAQFGTEFRDVVEGHFHTAIGERPSSNFTIRDTDSPVDYAQPLKLLRYESPHPPEPLLSGQAVRATPDRTETIVEAEGAREMVESIIAKTVSWGLDPRELLYTVVRDAGLDEDRIDIEGYGRPGYEPFLVRVPVENLDSTDRFDVGEVWFESIETTPDPQLTIEMFAKIDEHDIKTIANVVVTERFVLDAESIAIGAIEDALNAVVAATLFSYSKHPDGRSLSFSRERLLARPHARNAAYVIGSLDGRGWIRSTQVSAVLNSIDARLLIHDWPALGRSVAPSEIRLAAATLRSAADRSRALAERNQILWNAVEFYVAGASLPDLVSKQERKALKHAVKELRLPRPQTARALELLGGLNNPPLFAKLVHCAEQDGVPLSADERAMLHRLRVSRNELAHGRHARTMETELDQAVSIIARLVMFRWHAAGS